MNELTPEQIVRWAHEQESAGHRQLSPGQAALYETPDPLAGLRERTTGFGGPVRVDRMRTNHLVDPVVSPESVRFSFTLLGESSGGAADAMVDATVTVEHGAGELVWQSDVVRWDGSPIAYAGAPLEHDTVYRWRVRIDVPGSRPVESRLARFRTALADPDRELGGWIIVGTDEGDSPPKERAAGDAAATVAASADEKPYSVYTVTAPPWRGDPPATTTLHVAGVGFYRAEVNGVLVSLSELAPANSRPDELLLYDSWELPTDLLSNEMTLRLHLAEGYGRDYSQWGWRWMGGPGVRVLLRLAYEDGSREDICSGPDWRLERNEGWLASLYQGEHRDTVRNKRTPVRSGGSTPAGRLRPRDLPPLAAHAPITPIRTWVAPDGGRVYDFGQNIAGRVRLRVELAEKRELAVIHAERVTDAGALDLSTNREAQATDRVVAAAGTLEFEPAFTYHGFRYAAVYGAIDMRLEVSAVPIHAAVDSYGWFQSSSPRLNQLVSNARWAVANNLMSIPTDCPQRDERTPCLMDSAAVEGAALMLFDLKGYYESWSRRIAGDTGLPDWGGDQVNAVWQLFRSAGDLEPAREHFEQLVRWIRAQYSHGDGVTFPGGFGDWCAPNTTGGYMEAFNEPGLTNAVLLYRYSGMLAELAKQLGRLHQQAELCRLRDSLAVGFHRRYHQGVGRYGEQAPSQSGTIMALAESLVPEELRAQSLAWVREETARRGGFYTGIFATPSVLPVMQEAGALARALALLLDDEFPGFGFQIDNDATTLWEQWTNEGGMASHDHAMFAGICESIITTVVGLRPTGEVWTAAPTTTPGITSAAAVVETRYGPVAFGWESDGSGRTESVLYTPPGCALRY